MSESDQDTGPVVAVPDWQVSAQEIATMDSGLAWLQKTFGPLLALRDGVMAAYNAAGKTLQPLQAHVDRLKADIARYAAEAQRCDASLAHQRDATTRGIEALRKELTEARAAAGPALSQVHAETEAKKQALAMDYAAMETRHAERLVQLEQTEAKAQAEMEARVLAKKAELEGLQAQVKEAEARLAAFAQAVRRAGV
jgi:chromosome segregation ATPase